MLDEYFIFEEVNKLIFDLETNPKYYKKVIKNAVYSTSINDNLALYVFYDAIYKYKLLVDDIYLFNEYVENINKLFRKLDDIDDIIKGIHKLLCNLVSVTLNIKDMNDPDNKNTIIKTIYDKYIVNGYYVHGFPTVYEQSIFRNGIRTGTYENYYQYMRNIEAIFNKHGKKNIFKKDFNNKDMYFTDDFIMGCYYSSVAPGYFSNFLLNSVFSEDNRVENYQYFNYIDCCSGFTNYIDKENYDEHDKEMITKVVKNEWKYLNSVIKRVSILLVPRAIIGGNIPKLETFNNTLELYDVVDNILTAREMNVTYNGVIDSNNLDILSFYFPMRENNMNVLIIPNKVEKEEKSPKREPLNTYGVISVLIIAGCLLISLGIIVTVVMIGGI